MKKILFSPIGGTDPISNFRDGAMLHICRIYKPDIVYLYLSKEMCEFQEKDDRYRYCLEQLGKKLNTGYEECITDFSGYGGNPYAGDSGKYSEEKD